MKNVKKYSHDYTLAADANFILFAARKNLEQGYIDAAKKNIEDAREMLDKYLAGDNMKEDDDIYPGWVKGSDLDE